jgi:hypothetical protein
VTPAIDAHVRLDTHPIHPSAVTTLLTGSQARAALMALEAADWSVLADNALVLARIDHEESQWLSQATSTVYRRAPRPMSRLCSYRRLTCKGWFRSDFNAEDRR